MDNQIPASLRRVISTSPAAVLLVDTALDFVTASACWLAEFMPGQHPQGSLFGKGFPFSKTEWEKVFREGLQGTCSGPRDQVMRVNGKAVRLNWEVQPLYNDTDDINGLLIYMQAAGDNGAAAASRAKEQIRRSEEKFRGAFEYSAIGMALFSTEGNFIRVNHSLCQMLGYSKEELTRLNITAITHQEDQPVTRSLVNSLLDGTKNSYHTEKRYIHKNGSDVWVLLGVSILRDQQQQPLHFISQIQDITPIKAAEHALAVSEGKYRKIFENTQDIYYSTDPRGIITEISPSVEKYTDRPRSAIIGNPFTDFYYSRGDSEDILSALKVRGAVTDFEVLLKIGDTRVLYASVNARMIYEQGVLTGTEGTIRDITLRKKQENELRALNHHREKLLSVIGHDLRNPVAASLKLAELAMMDIEHTSVKELGAYLIRIQYALGNANALLEDLMFWAINQINDMRFNPVLIPDLNLQIENGLQRLRPLAELKGLEIKSFRVEPLPLFADPGMLDAVIRNLVSNAIKFTSCGSITVSAENSAEGVQFCVSDTGTGIPEEVIGQLFEKGFNYTTYGTSGEKGTGLGLDLCRDFVEKHGGRIWAENNPPHGSAFYFIIPV